MSRDNLFCETCEKDSFTIGPMQEDQVILTCKGCSRPYIMEPASIIDPSGGPKAKDSIKWNWAKGRWDPM